MLVDYPDPVTFWESSGYTGVFLSIMDAAATGRLLEGLRATDASQERDIRSRPRVETYGVRCSFVRHLVPSCTTSSETMALQSGQGS